MSDLPDGWEWTTLGEIASTTLGKMLDRGKSSGELTVPYLRNVNVQWGSINLESLLEMRMSREEFEFLSLVSGDLLVCEGGEVGRAAIWEGRQSDISFQKALHRVRPYDEIDSRYLLYFFRNMACTGELLTYATGSTIKHLPQQKLKEIKIPLPPLAEQRRIVAALEGHLSRLDAGSRSLGSADSRSLSWLAAARQGAVSGGDDKADLPDGWKVGALRDVLERVEAGKSFAAEGRPARDGEWGIIKVSAMTWGEFRPKENKAVLDPSRIDSRYKVRAGDILVSRANTRDYVGAPVLVGEHRERLLLSDKSLRLIPAAGVSRDWLISVLSSPYVRHQISEKATGTKESMRNISQSALLDVQIPVPPVEDQDQVAARSDDVVRQNVRLGNAIRAAAKRADQLRRGLLREAFAGRLVDQDSGDEPASVLLERIRRERESAPKVKRGRKSRKSGGDGASAESTFDVGRPLPESVGQGTQDSLDLGL